MIAWAGIWGGAIDCTTVVWLGLKAGALARLARRAGALCHAERQGLRGKGVPCRGIPTITCIPCRGKG